MQDVTSEEEGVSPLPRAFLLAAAIASIASFALVLTISSFDDAATFYLYREDRWLLLAAVAVIGLASWRIMPSPRALLLSPRLLLLGGAAAALLLYLGHRWILLGYDFSRDEQMAVFDARSFATGRLVQPLPALWQAHPDALNRLYMLQPAHPIAWGSDYLPINAGLRTIVGLVADPALTGPVLTLLGGVALWKSARLLWPAEREAAFVALLLYAGSGQIALAGMTAFAMPAHLTFNLIWLWLFLLDRRGTDVGALAVGFLATGLHEPAFHPLFAAPFLALLLARRAWPRLALFVVGYAAIGAFWMSWPAWMTALSGGGHGGYAPHVGFLARLQFLLLTNTSPRFLDMTANLFRFLAWQHVLLVPLAAVGFWAARRDGMARALAVSAASPVAVMFVLLPGQGNGFGYRYLHGEIGCLILLAIFGWRYLVTERGVLRTLLTRTSLGMLIVVLPMQLAMSHALYAPYARVDRQIAAVDSDYVILDREDVPFAVNLILNRPDLSNRPIRLDARAMDGELRRTICRAHAHVGLPRSRLFVPIGAYLGWPLQRSAADGDIATLAPVLQMEGCRVSLFG